MPEAATSLSAADVERIRAQLPAVHSIVYLNAGTLGPMPTCAIDAIAEMHTYDTQTRQSSDLWEKLAAMQASSRSVAAALTRASSDQVALMHSTHEGINTCVWGMTWNPGDEVVTTDQEHPGLLIPLRHLRDRDGVSIRVAVWEPTPDAWVDAIMQQVSPRTRAVLVSHVSWVTGWVAPLRALAAVLPDSVKLIVDGAQSTGVIPVDLADGWDAHTISGQKWTLGPNGSGALVLKDPEAWLPTFGGFMQVENPAESLTSPLRSTGLRFEFSQEAMTPHAGFAESVSWLMREIGVDRSAAHVASLNTYARERIAAAGIVSDDEAMHGDYHLLCVDVRAGSAPGITVMLADQGISIRYLGDDRLRISLGAWNTQQDIDTCVDAISAALQAGE